MSAWGYGLLALGLLLTAMLLGAWRLSLMAVARQAGRKAVWKAPHNRVDGRGKLRADYEAARQWWETVPTGEAWITSGDGLRLHALCALHGKGERWAICVHGYTGRGSNMIYAGQRFYQRGYSLLMPDCRGHGDSEGKSIGMGWPDRLDLLQWIQWILIDRPEADIILFGISMGGAAVMMLAGEALPPQVKAIVEDCGFTSVWDQFAYQLKAIFGLPPFPMMHLATLFARKRAGYDFRQASALDQLRKARVPILFIHGSEDSFVPAHMMEEAYAACASCKDKLMVPDAGHAEAAHIAPDAYWDKVFGFLASC